MSELFAQYVGGAFLAAGSFFLLVGALGIMRMPDLFTRMHAASVGEALGGGMLLVGMMIHAGFSLISFKLLVLLGVIFFFGPVATHALARAARYAGVEPQLAVPAKGAATSAGSTAKKPAAKSRRKPANARRKPVKRGHK